MSTESKISKANPATETATETRKVGLNPTGVKRLGTQLLYFALQFFNFKNFFGVEADEATLKLIEQEFGGDKGRAMRVLGEFQPNSTPAEILAYLEANWPATSGNAGRGEGKEKRQADIDKAKTFSYEQREDLKSWLHLEEGAEDTIHPAGRKMGASRLEQFNKRTVREANRLSANTIVANAKIKASLMKHGVSEADADKAIAEGTAEKMLASFSTPTTTTATATNAAPTKPAATKPVAQVTKGATALAAAASKTSSKK